MSKWIPTLIIAGIAFGVGVGVGVLGLLWATGGTSDPSQDIADVAPTLSLNDPTPTPSGAVAQQQLLNELNDQVGVLTDQIDALSTAVGSQSNEIAIIGTRVANPSSGVVADASVEPTIAPTATWFLSGGATEEPAETTPQADDTTADALPERALFRISSEESEARFMIEEVLAGNPTTVIGTTRQVGGDIIINYANPALSTVGTVVVNARTLKTDNEFRDQSIRGQILESSKDEYEFIRFEPVELIGLPSESVAVGSTVEFQIRGNLTIKDVTREVLFDAELTAVSSERIEGMVSVEVVYADFGLTINPPPTVGGIGETVILELDFAAETVEE